MKNKFKNVGLDKVLDIISQVLDDNCTKSINISSEVYTMLGRQRVHHAKHDWVLINENKVEEFDVVFKELVLYSTRCIIPPSKTELIIKRELDTIIVKCFSISYNSGLIYETTLRCNNYIVNTLIHGLIEQIYLKNQEVMLNENSSLLKTIQSIYQCPILNNGSNIEIEFNQKNDVFVKKINIFYPIQ